MLDRLLVGYGRARGSEDALALARMLASVSGGEVLVACHSDPSSGEHEVTLPPHEPYLRARTPLILPGVPKAKALCRHAMEQDADTVVLGARAAHLPPGIGTAGRILTESPCAVAIAPRGFSERPIRWPTWVGLMVTGEDEGALRMLEPLGRSAVHRLHLFWTDREALEAVREGLADMGLDHLWISDERHEDESQLLEACRGLDLLVIGRPETVDEHVLELLGKCPSPLLVAEAPERRARRFVSRRSDAVTA